MEGQEWAGDGVAGTSSKAAGSPEHIRQGLGEPWGAGQGADGGTPWLGEAPSVSSTGWTRSSLRGGGRLRLELEPGQLAPGRGGGGAALQWRGSNLEGFLEEVETFTADAPGLGAVWGRNRTSTGRGECMCRAGRWPVTSPQPFRSADELRSCPWAVELRRRLGARDSGRRSSGASAAQGRSWSQAEQPPGSAWAPVAPGGPQACFPTVRCEGSGRWLRRSERRPPSWAWCPSRASGSVAGKPSFLGENRGWGGRGRGPLSLRGRGRRGREQRQRCGPPRWGWGRGCELGQLCGPLNTHELAIKCGSGRQEGGQRRHCSQLWRGGGEPGEGPASNMNGPQCPGAWGAGTPFGPLSRSAGPVHKGQLDSHVASSWGDLGGLHPAWPAPRAPAGSSLWEWGDGGIWGISGSIPHDQSFFLFPHKTF